MRANGTAVYQRQHKCCPTVPQLSGTDLLAAGEGDREAAELLGLPRVTGPLRGALRPGETDKEAARLSDELRLSSEPRFSDTGKGVPPSERHTPDTGLLTLHA